MRKIRSIWSFITRRKAGAICAPTNLPASPSGSWYSTLDLPLHLFKRCLIDNDLSVLILTGQSTPNELYNAWEAIYERFLDAMKDKDGLYKVRLMNKVNNLAFKYRLIKLCIEFLRKAHSPSIEATLINHVRLDGVLVPDDRRQYLQYLQTAENRSQHLLIELEILEAEKAILEKKSPGGQSITHDQFSSLEAQVSFFMKFRINPKDISTGEFASYYSMMRETNDLIRKQTKSRR